MFHKKKKKKWWNGSLDLNQEQSVWSGSALIAFVILLDKLMYKILGQLL